MEQNSKNKLKILGLENLLENWDSIMKKAQGAKPSYHRFLSDIIESEYQRKIEKARLARIKRARIPYLYVMETFPFEKQTRLVKKKVMQLYDSLSFVADKQDLIFIGPTGCGKTGLATSFLVHAINAGYRGLFMDFSALVHKLYQVHGEGTEEKFIKKMLSYDILLIDELGYISCEPEQASLFFDLLRRRYSRCTTIITTQLGFSEWGGFLHDPHITAALLDRITTNCAVFNMKDCISIRPKKIVYATSK